MSALSFSFCLQGVGNKCTAALPLPKERGLVKKKELFKRGRPKPISYDVIYEIIHILNCGFEISKYRTNFKFAVQYMKHFIYHFTSILHGLIRTQKWPALNVSGFIAQLVRASHRYREVTGSNPVEVLAFSGFLNCVHYCDDHSSLLISSQATVKNAQQDSHPTMAKKKPSQFSTREKHFCSEWMTQYCI